MFAVSILALAVATAKAALTTRSQPPYIATITPTQTASAEGGSRLVITGANFEQSGLFSSRAVFVGGEACKIIDYYTNDEKIVCMTPNCVSLACRSDQDWQGSEDASVSIYVNTVEGILEAFTTIKYNGGYTPSIFKMQHNAWATGISQVVGKMMVPSLTGISIKIGEQFAELGNDNEINDAQVDMWSRSSVINYRPPADMPAGFYNLSLFVDSSQYPSGYYGDGKARMYPIQESFAYGFGYFYDSNFDATLSGDAYSLCLMPVVTSVFPEAGSVAGGTELRVRGHGFSAVRENMIVYVAGRRCDITRTGDANGGAMTEEFTCLTRPAEALETIRTQLLTPSQQFTDPQKQLPSSRNYGSAGWWMRMWPYAAYQNNQLTDANVQISANMRHALSFSFLDLFGYYWPGQLGYLSQYWDPQAFAIEFSTYFVAPYTGTS
jgi:hypothetical protein